MINELKQILLNDLNMQLDEYNTLKSTYDKLIEQIKGDSGEDEYLKQKKELDKKFGLSKFFGNKKYLEQKNILDLNYKIELDNFEKIYDEYSKIRKQLAKCNIYELKRKIDKISSAESLKQMNVSVKDAEKILTENGIDFRLTDAEIKG